MLYTCYLRHHNHYHVLIALYRTGQDPDVNTSYIAAILLLIAAEHLGYCAEITFAVRGGSYWVHSVVHMKEVIRAV